MGDDENWRHANEPILFFILSVIILLLFENSIPDALYYHNQVIYADFHKSKCVLVPRPE